MESLSTIQQLVDELIDSLQTHTNITDSPFATDALSSFTILPECELSLPSSSIKSLKQENKQDVAENLGFVDLYQTSTRLAQESNDILKQLENIKNVVLNKRDNFQQYSKLVENFENSEYMNNNNNKRKRSISQWELGGINEQSFSASESSYKENIHSSSNIQKFSKISRTTIRIGLSKNRPSNYSQQWKKRVLKE